MIKEGLILTGSIVASNIRTGTRNDDGKAYARRNAMISNGIQVYTFSESVDPNVKSDPYPVGKKATVEVSYANTASGMVSVGGDITIEK